MTKMTIPVKNNINIERGTIVLSLVGILPKENMHILTLGDIHLEIDSSDEENTLNLFVKNIRGSSLSFVENNIDLVFSWENNQLWVSLYEQKVLPKHLGNTEIITVNNIFNDMISLFEDNYFNGTYKRISIYSQPFNYGNTGLFDLEVFEETANELFEADFTKPTHYNRDVVIEDTFAPRDGSPILIEDDEGPLNRQYFFDEVTGEYQKETTETFIYKNEDYRKLSYEGVEDSYHVKIEFDTSAGQDILYEGVDFHLIGQDIHFSLSNERKEIYYGLNYTVTYQLARSYNIDFNENVPHDGFRVNLVNMKANNYGKSNYSSTENISLIREGNRFEDKYLASEIELNPLVNPQVQGFMYISTKEQHTQDFRIRVSSSYLTGDGIDTANVIVEAIDGEGNEVLSPYVDLYIINEKGELTTSLGYLQPVLGYQSMKARNTSGQVHYQYSAPYLNDKVNSTYKIFIIAYDRKNKIGAQIPLYIQSVKGESYTLEDKNKKYIDMPFEYFARYFDKKLPEGHPMWVFDSNNNNKLDREDLDNFIKKTEDEHFMQSINEELIKWELRYFAEPRTWADYSDKKWTNYRNMTWLQMVYNQGGTSIESE